MITTERQLVVAVCDFLTQSGYCDVATEIPNFARSVDIAALCDNLVYCIEAKLRDWKRVLQQALQHRNVADYVIIAMAVNSVSEGHIDLLAQAGIGLIVCDPRTGKCEVLLEPRRNQYAWQPQQSIFRDLIVHFKNETAIQQ